MVKPVLEGKLEFLGLGDILQLLSGIDAIGLLRLKSKYSHNIGIIYFINGNPANAINGDLSGIEAFYSLFGWTEGAFSFSEEVIKEKKVINMSGMGLIMEGLRLVDDGITEKLGPVSYAKQADAEAKAPIVKGPVVDYSYVVEEEDWIDDDKIVIEDAHGRWMWVVLDGIIEIVKNSSKGPVTLLRLGSGSIIGSLASFLFEGSIRSASAVAVQNVQLGVLDAQRLATEYATMSAEFKRLLYSIDNRLKQITKETVKYSFDYNKFGRFIRQQKIILKQGKSDNRLFTIIQGKAYIVRKTDKHFVLLGILTKGDFFGAIPFISMDHEPFQASVFGSKDLKFKRADTNHLEDEYQRLSPTLHNLIEHTGTCISVTSSLACGVRDKLPMHKKR
ncbi:cyclic nucleotide-binding domain-containing protein [Desulfococcaceae bacterium HSG9]|nr:cyclic nucleotide-binding domain-containing protein [Desulfococcaceae bacterium HSG9]